MPNLLLFEFDMINWSFVAQVNNAGVSGAKLDDDALLSRSNTEVEVVSV